jgi:uncharacterized protein YbcV (DUF1398 family)
MAQMNTPQVPTKKYEPLAVAHCKQERFIEYLVMHQDGQTDYYTFCQHAAQSGIANGEYILK